MCYGLQVTVRYLTLLNQAEDAGVNGLLRRKFLSNSKIKTQPMNYETQKANKF